MAAAWKPDNEPNDDGRMRFGRRARTWLASRIRQELLRYLSGTAPTQRHGAVAIAGTDITALVLWYMEYPMRYVRWIATDSYAGQFVSTGVWRFDADAVKGDIAQGVSELKDRAARATDADAVATLDDWLRADKADALSFAGERGGSERMRLSPDERRALLMGAMSRRANWPRPCALCGEMFRNPAKGQKRCPACRSAKRVPTPSTKTRKSHPRRIALSPSFGEGGNEAANARTADTFLRQAADLQEYATALLRSARTGEDPGPPPWDGARE